ncbi:iron-containing redox enzyme family protein [Mycobacterium sp. Y57]|uniref:iron-containing redox enzyme family protein n=1 Tax=Mycolicibacterium xanthum TaxID=2796469 RepID=UPI001C8428BE|nr:iron-containing redox enzyme family protein [Mycolicibacterium xanthum]MBX7430519.1 iron-containing redox enzyme family protein [Mycolicibacterium xanthum]
MTGLPYDGRSRRVPDWTSDVSPDKFEDLLVETVVTAAMASIKKPFVIPDHYTQAQARLYHGTSLKYFSFFAWRFPSWLLEVASRCPYQDVRRELIEDCVDEEVGDEDAGGRCHVDVLYEEAEACGISREEIATTAPSPLIQTCVLALDDLARTLSWEASFAAIAGLEITNSKPAVELRAKLATPEQLANAQAAIASSLPERLGIAGENLLFNALHAYKDQFHGGGELELLVKYATDPHTQNEMLWAARTGVETFGLMLSEIDRLALETVEG